MIQSFQPLSPKFKERLTTLLIMTSSVRQMDSWTAREMDSRTARQSVRWTAGQSDSWTAKQLDSQSDGQLNGQADGQLDSQSDGQPNSRSHRHMDSWARRLEAWHEGWPEKCGLGGRPGSGGSKESSQYLVGEKSGWVAPTSALWWPVNNTHHLLAYWKSIRLIKLIIN